MKFNELYKKIICEEILTEVVLVNKNFINKLIEKFNLGRVDLDMITDIIVSKYSEIRKQPNSREILYNFLRDSVRNGELATNASEIYHLFQIRGE